MDDDLHLLDTIDRRLDPLVPPALFPPDIVGRGRRARARRTTTRVLAAAAAVLVVAVGADVVLEREGSRDASPTDLKPPAIHESSAVPDGWHAVGYGGVALALPPKWSAIDCGTDSTPIRFALGPCGIGTVVSVRPVDAEAGIHRSRLSEPTTLHGLEVFRLDDCSFGDCQFSYSFSSDVYVPSLGLAVFVGGANGSLVRQIAATIAPTPDGMVAVPPIPVDTTFDVARELLSDAGFVVNLPDFQLLTTIEGTEPSAGTLVEAGSTVELVTSLY